MERQDSDIGLKKIYAKVSAENAEDLIFRNHALFELGSLYFEKCDFPNAVDCLEKVKTEALQFHLYDNYFRSISLLMRVHAERLDFDKHESLIREVLQVGGSLANYKRYLPKFHYNQGIAAMYQKQFEEARRQFQQAAAMAKELLTDPALSAKDNEDLRRDLLNSQYGIAVIDKDEKQPAQALERTAHLLKELKEFSEGEHASEHFQLHDLEASLLILEGNCYRDLGQTAKSLDKYWAAHGILKAHRNWSLYYYVLLGLGRTYLQMGNPERAQIFFDLIQDAIQDLELKALKRALDSVSTQVENPNDKLLIDKERKVVIEKTLGEIHFERRFVLLEILYLLASQPGKVFSKEELVDRIWRESYNPMIHDSKVYTSISRLRKLIEPDFKQPVYILNERDGYAFNPAITLEETSPRLRAKQPASPVVAGIAARAQNLAREGVSL